METALAEAKTPAEAAKLPGLATQLAVAAAWSPNPKKPPLYFDMPFGDRLEMTFRRLYTAQGVHNYFWKARPGR